jgi:beta-mannanase
MLMVTSFQLAIAIVLLSSAAVLAGESPAAAKPASAPVARWLGVDGLAVPAFNKLTGGQARVKLRFCKWNESWGNRFSFTAKAITEDSAANAMTMMSWGPNDSAPNILSGKHDAYLHQWAKDAAVDGRPFMLRMAWEANGFWYPWSYSGEKAQSTPQQFLQMWRYVHHIFAAEGAHSVKWVWCANVLGGPIGDFTAAYPGDEYVDYVGLDGYNFGPAQKGNHWQSFGECFKRSYDVMTALTSKPLIICETACAETGGDKAVWVTAAFSNEIPNTMPKIIGVIWFNENPKAGWTIDSSRAALTAFQAIAQDPQWQAPFSLKP